MPRRPSPPVALAVTVAVVLLGGSVLIGALTGGPRVIGGDPAGVLATRAPQEDGGEAAPPSAVTSPSEPAQAPPPEERTPSPEEMADVAAGVLPGEVPKRLDGRFVLAQGEEPAPGPGPARTVRVEIEAGLPMDVDAFARFVMDTLNDPQGWGADGSVSFARTAGEPDIRVLVASPATIDALCAPLATNGRWSCGRYGHAALNADRWVEGSAPFLEAGGDLTEYRRYLVNHEVGHLLGAQHTGCPTPGETAPIMLQQSLGLSGCRPNGWPHPAAGG